MNSPSVLSCRDKRTKEGCNRGREVGTVYSGRDGEGPVSLRISRDLAKTKSYDRNSVFRWSSERAYLSNDRS